MREGREVDARATLEGLSGWTGSWGQEKLGTGYLSASDGGCLHASMPWQLAGISIVRRQGSPSDRGAQHLWNVVYNNGG